jgi:hypothetical protein
MENLHSGLPLNGHENPFRTTERLAQSNAAQWETHTRRRNRKYSDPAVAIV